MNTSHWGRVVGPVGLVLLLAAALTMVVSGETWLGQINVLLGLGCVSFYLVTNFRQLSQLGSSKGTFFLATSALTSLLLVVGLAAANYLAMRHPKSWDLTKNQIFTLAPDTTQTLAGLPGEVKVVAFFQEGERAREGFEELFRRYRALNEKFSYRFVDPVRDPAAVKQYSIREGGPRVVLASGSVEQRVTNPTEEELTNALVKVTHSADKKVYFLVGHGEADLGDRAGLGLSLLAAKMASEGLQSAPLSLARNPEIPRDARALVIAGPQSPYSAGEASLLQGFLNEGGKLLLLLEPNTPSGLEELLRSYGVTLDPGLVADASAQRLGSSPFIPVVVQYGTHPITQNFRLQTLFPTAASLNLGATPGVTAVPLLLSLPTSWVEQQPQAQPLQHDPGEKPGPLTLGVALTKHTRTLEPAVKRGDETRLLVVGDRDFLTNGVLPQGGNQDLALNGLSWLSEQSERLSIRPRTREASRVYLTGLQLAGIRFAATELPVALLAFGLVVFFHRRAK